MPITAARSTLGSVRASSTNPSTPAAPTTTSHRPRAPHHRAMTSRNPTTRVRLVPETASRCVSPVVRKSASTSSGRPASSPTTRAGTSARCAGGRCDTEARRDSRTAPAPRHQTPGRASTSGSPRASSSAARSPSSASTNRPDTRTVPPSAGRDESAPASTSTGAPSVVTRPRPRTSLTRARHITWSVRPEVSSTGSEETVPTTDTAAPSCASAATGLWATWCARRAVTENDATRTRPTPASSGRCARRRAVHAPTRPSSSTPAATATAGATDGARTEPRSAPAHAVAPSNGIRRSGRPWSGRWSAASSPAPLTPSRAGRSWPGWPRRCRRPRAARRRW